MCSYFHDAGIDLLRNATAGLDSAAANAQTATGGLLAHLAVAELAEPESGADTEACCSSCGNPAKWVEIYATDHQPYGDVEFVESLECAHCSIRVSQQEIERGEVTFERRCEEGYDDECE